ncbi:PPOX class F420-dependent oxidoreductase [Desertimonas flava]|jgi:PPOX class probable F420-dependent enzyme|uniref:PPOX class F420-dependent oxidoreductase n=1 Tax=Desertimonas flava TaxID=2064846 RepID=UPI000E3541E3|nr:PPOX class F420-dependent oxidoreductase [Desertimonas flava]
MELSTALDFARTNKHGVLVTLKRDGKPQLSNILYSVSDDGAAQISITATRAKYHNLARDPWAALHITRDDFYAYAVLEGEVEMSAIAGAPDDDAVEALVTWYRTAAGEHPDWDEFRRAMVDEKRVLVTFRPTRAYGMLQLPR